MLRHSKGMQEATATKLTLKSFPSSNGPRPQERSQPRALGQRGWLCSDFRVLPVDSSPALRAVGFEEASKRDLALRPEATRIFRNAQVDELIRDVNLEEKELLGLLCPRSPGFSP